MELSLTAMVRLTIENTFDPLCYPCRGKNVAKEINLAIGFSAAPEFVSCSGAMESFLKMEKSSFDRFCFVCQFNIALTVRSSISRCESREQKSTGFDCLLRCMWDKEILTLRHVCLILKQILVRERACYISLRMWQGTRGRYRCTIYESKSSGLNLSAVIWSSRVAILKKLDALRGIYSEMENRKQE